MAPGDQELPALHVVPPPATPVPPMPSRLSAPDLGHQQPIPIESHGPDGMDKLALVGEDELIKIKTSNLPSQQEFQRWIGAVVVESARQIVTGRLPFKSAGEASKVARDFVSIARDLSWDEPEDLKEARTQKERLDALRNFKRLAEQNMIGMEDTGEST